MAKKKSSPRKSTKRSTAVEVPTYKPSMTIKGVSGLKVGNKAKMVVTGRVIEESIRDYEAPKGTKVYRMEIDKVRKARK